MTYFGGYFMYFIFGGIILVLCAIIIVLYVVLRRTIVELDQQLLEIRLLTGIIEERIDREHDKNTNF